MSDEPEFSWPPSPEEAAEMRVDLMEILGEIEGFDQDYEPRNVLVLLALAAAATTGLPAGFRIDPAEPDWPVAYIELPTGQVSWHMSAHATPYDGHTTPEKYERIKAFVGGADMANAAESTDSESNGA